MLKISKITIENFRGIKAPLCIDFVKNKNHTSALIYGSNGTGKSSIVDAWEWLLNFKIEWLRKEGVSERDFPHKSSNGNNSYILSEFNHPSIKTAKTTFNSTKITVPVASGEYDQFKAFCTYPNYLRYSDLQEFVFRTKTEKYKYIAKFFGLEKFTQFQDSLQTTINKQSTNLQVLQGNLAKSISTINAITGKETVDEAIVIEFVNTITAKHKFSNITEFKDCEKTKDSLSKIVTANPVTKELTEWQAFQRKQNQFYPVTSVKSDCIALEKAFAEIKSDVESIRQLILLNLYETSTQVIPQLEDKSKCPVCDTVFNGDLLKHIKEKHATLNELSKNKKAFDTKQTLLQKCFENLTKKISAIQSEDSAVVLKELKTFFDDIKTVNTELPAIKESLNKQLKDLDKIEISESTLAIKTEDFILKEAAYKKIVTDKITTLSTDEKSKSLALDFTNLNNIITAFKDYSINKAKVEYLTTISVNLDTISTELTSYIQNRIQSTFTTISADVFDYFNALERSNLFIKNPEIKLLSGKDKAVELEIEFMNEKITPAFKFLSESQVNSFGLAIFLAAVKHFNNEFKFFILDDVINSFDCFKRPRVSQLLASKFADFQVLLLTHDQIFFDTVQRDFPNWQRYKFTGWDYENGPRYRLAKNYSEEIQGYLDDDNPITAGSTLGRYFEWTFGVVNESMQTPIRYKIENVYTLSEFYEPLVCRFRDKLKLKDYQHKLVVAFDQLEQGTVFRNYCAHWKNEANPFTKPEIESIFKKWLEIENLIYCTTCKSFVKFEKNGSDEYVRCNCNALNLKDNSFYVPIIK
jgi:recombinational DNA repair ATPase RecF